MQAVLGMVMTYAHIQRIDLTLRKRNDMHVDEARGMGTASATGKGNTTMDTGHAKEMTRTLGIF